jgi:hypothetical protein
MADKARVRCLMCVASFRYGTHTPLLRLFGSATQLGKRTLGGNDDILWRAMEHSENRWKMARISGHNSAAFVAL